VTAEEISREEAKATSENRAGSEADDPNVYNKSGKGMPTRPKQTRVGHELDVSLERTLTPMEVPYGNEN
jgi:hypothetical protein